MYSDWGWLLWLAAFVWLGILTALVLRGRSGSKASSKILRSVFEDGDGSEVKFEQLLRKVNGLGSQIDDLKDRVSEEAERGLAHIQRVELIRFNPYEDTGGDQSFAIAMLDKNGNGLVLTSHHARSGTRVFAKPVVMGRPEKYEFSREETEVVKKAMGR